MAKTVWQKVNDHRARERDVELPKLTPASKRRRTRYSKDPVGFMRYYGSDVFYNPFTDDQLCIIESLKSRILDGGMQAIAASRGDGKTTIAKWMALWGLIYGYVRYLVIVASNGGHSDSILADIKANIEINDKLMIDYPDLCVPVRALEGVPQRAKMQTVNGNRSMIKWGVSEIALPVIDGFAGSGAVVRSCGIDSAIRGLVKGSLRPDMVIVDDPQTRESAASQSQTNARRETLQKDILGLAGPGKTIAVMVLCTVIRKGDLADELTDRKLSPAWNGIKQKFLISEPENLDLWDKYIFTRQQDQINGDATGRNAHQFYADNRAEMDKGAIVNNPYRFNKKLELSALEHAYNKIADMGRAAFDAELQNDPSELSQETSGITPATVCRALSEIPKGQKLSDSVVVRGVDVSAKDLVWVDVCLKKDGSGSVIDYGIEPLKLHGKVLTDKTARAHMEREIYAGLDRLIDEGERPDLTLVDSGSGLHAMVVYAWCTANKGCRAIKGFGQGQRTYSQPKSGGVKRGKHWHASLNKKPVIWLYHLDADYWKNQVHRCFLTPPGVTGRLTVYGSEPSEHTEYARQICAEIWTRSFTEGKGWKEGFVVAYHKNHYLDATAYALAGGDMLGMRVQESGPKKEAGTKKQTNERKRLTADEIRARRNKR